MFKPDITSRAEIEALVNTFYDRVRVDDLFTGEHAEHVKNCAA